MQLTARNVTLGYEQSVVSEKINFEMGQGDYLCVVGENGAGKSTLMKAILGLKPPISGTIVFGDGLKPNEIGYLPQQTTLQRDFPASVDEVVLSGCLSVRIATVLHKKGTHDSGSEYGKVGHCFAPQAELQGAFRRSAAAGFAGSRALRNPKAADSG